PPSTCEASAGNAPDAPVTMAVLPLMSNSESGFFKRSSAMTYSHSSWPGLSRPSRLVGHGGALSIGMAGTSPAMTVCLLLLRLRRRHGDQHGHHLVAAVDDLPALVDADEAGVERLQHALLAVDDDGQLAREHRVDLLGGRGVRAGAAARQEVRQADHELLGPAGLGAEQAQRGIVAMVGSVVALGLGKALDQHQNFSPFSMRYVPF